MSNQSPKLAPGDYVFLAFLTWGPMTAYDIKKFMAESVSNFWSAAHSQVYQQARRLTRDGYVREQTLPGARRKRQLQLTAKGRRVVTNWLRQPARAPQYHAESLVKLFFATQAGDLDATRRMLEHERDGFAERLRGFEEHMKLLQADPEMRHPAMTLDLGIRLHRLMIEWADRSMADLAEEEAARA